MQKYIASNRLKGLRIGLLTASVSRLGGGVFEAVVAHAAMVRECGGDACIFGLEDKHSQEDRERFSPSSVQHGTVTGPAQIGFSRDLLSKLLSADLDMLHLHGIWMYPSRLGLQWARRTQRPYVISPHGMLDPWITGRGKAKKTLARLGYERASWTAADAFHALTDREGADIARETGRTGSIVIPNAGPPLILNPQTARAPRFSYLGRIHPKKNIDALITAWKVRSADLEALGATLTIAGWGEQDHVEDLRRSLVGAPASIEFVGPIFGDEKLRLLSQTRFLVLPSHSEGLPMVVLEAWAAGAPCLMTSECNLPEGFAERAALECGYTAGDLAPLLLQAATMSEAEWLAMSGNAVRLASGKFSASNVASQWADAYCGLIEASVEGGAQ